MYSELWNRVSIKQYTVPWFNIMQNRMQIHAITRDLEIAKRPKKIQAWPNFAQSTFNFIIQIVPVVQNELACSPFAVCPAVRPMSRHDPVHCIFINLMKLPNVDTHFFGTSIKPFYMFWIFWCPSCHEKMSLWWIMIIRYKIGYVHLDVNIYMRISMLHIQFINFPFAHRVTEFLISPRHRFHGWAFENLQHVIFQHVIFDLRVLIRITTFCGFDVNWHRVFRKLAPYDTAPFGELQSINNEYPWQWQQVGTRTWNQNLKPWCRGGITPALSAVRRCSSYHFLTTV